LSPRWAGHERTELKAAIHVWKKCLLVESGSAVLEVIKRF